MKAKQAQQWDTLGLESSVSEDQRWEKQLAWTVNKNQCYGAPLANKQI